MIIALKKFKKLLICLGFALSIINANAQTALLQSAIDKLEGCKNFSYECIEKTLDYTTDTAKKQHRDIFQKAPGDKNFGYLFSLETQETGNNYHVIDIYNGQNLISLAPDDSTYQFADIKKFSMQSALPVFLRWLKGRPEKKPAEMAGDTAINGAVCRHLIFHVYDTTINKEHYHTDIDVFIDKLSNLPGLITIGEKVPLFGNVANYYIAYQYANYKLNQEGIELAAITVPDSFHLQKDKTVLPLLAPGTTAPDWTLYITDGKRLSLAQMKGKVVLMDLFFIGCSGCMASLQSLDRIYTKYKNKNFALVSISTRDSRKAVAAFKKKYHIKNPACGDGANVAQAYHSPGAPLFYFIDKEGKIDSVQYGYLDNFEKKATLIINKLLNK